KAVSENSQSSPTVNDAIKSKNENIVRSALEAGARIVNGAIARSGARHYSQDSLFCAIRTGNPNIVRMVLDAGAEIVTNATFPNGKRQYANDSLLLAISSGNPDIVKMILDAGAPIINEATFNDGLERQYCYDSLQVALNARGNDVRGNEEIIDLLLISGANPEKLSNENENKRELIERKQQLREQLSDLENLNKVSKSPNSQISPLADACQNILDFIATELAQKVAAKGSFVKAVKNQRTKQTQSPNNDGRN
ncbi:MAG: hypothetical protein O3B09_04430, partial [Proteobacteria bacterium]|nr:hypothetical protein [Pseudomonadota bacterium]